MVARGKGAQRPPPRVWIDIKFAPPRCPVTIAQNRSRRRREGMGSGNSPPAGPPLYPATRLVSKEHKEGVRGCRKCRYTAPWCSLDRNQFFHTFRTLGAEEPEFCSSMIWKKLFRIERQLVLPLQYAEWKGGHDGQLCARWMQMQSGSGKGCVAGREKLLQQPLRPIQSWLG
jgi:hypothetical protein